MGAININRKYAEEMKIKLLCRDIDIVIVSGGDFKKLLDKDDNCNCGMSIYSKNLITVERCNDSFIILMHEIAHFWQERIGHYNTQNYDKELVADCVGYLTNQLIIENGLDIFERLKKFAEE
jgi:hypothetical protein